MTVSALNPEELALQLSQLPGWQLVNTCTQKPESAQQQALRVELKFHSFKAAIAFMQSLVPLFEQSSHHPTWENQWRTLTISLTTWDIGNRISALDTHLAHEISNAYSNFKQ